MSWTTTTGWRKPGLLCTLVWVLFWFGSHKLSLGASSTPRCALSISSEGDVFVPVNIESVRATFDSQSAASGSNPKSQRKPQLKQPIFAQFLANATCFFKEGGGFPQISTRILSKVCKSLPNPSQTWAQIQKYSENRFFFFFFSPALLLLVLARRRKSRGWGGEKKNGEKDDAKIVKCQTRSVWALGKSLGWLLMLRRWFIPTLPFILPGCAAHCLYQRPHLYITFFIGLYRVAVLQTINMWSLSLLPLQGLHPRTEEHLSSLVQQEPKSPVSSNNHKK